MTYHSNDPDGRDPGRPVVRSRNTTSWVLAAIAAIAAIGLIFWATSTGVNLAGTDRPVATPTTTGAAPPATTRPVPPAKQQ
jgi:hypothetical protein